MGIFIDLTKAFDLINHNLLLHKLSKYGIRGLPLELIRSYLTDRSQYVSIDQVNSNTQRNTLGVPQGSILGPFFFLVYINDLPIQLTCKTILYADDTTLFVSGSTIRDVYHDANKVMHQLSSWLIVNNLIANFSKTTYMLFQPKNKKLSSDNLTLHFFDTVITQVDHTKFLGVIIDQHLSWRHHIDHLCKTIYPVVSTLYRLRDILPIKTLLTIYKSFIQSRLDYCVVVYGNTYKTSLQPLQVAQNTAIRTMLHMKKYESVRSSYPLLNILPLNKSIQFRSLLLTHQILNRKMVIPHIELNVKHTIVNTRSSSQRHLAAHTSRTNYGDFMFTNYSAKTWNSLPLHIRDITRFSSFRTALLDFLSTDSLF